MLTWLKKLISRTKASSGRQTTDPVFLGFWKNISEKARQENRPLYVLAPMADVTDCAFRKMINKYGKPDVTWTEFVSADGLIRATPEGKSKLMRDLLYNVHDNTQGNMHDSVHKESGIADAADLGGAENNFIDKIDERPIVAQLFSSNPEYMRQAAKLVADLGFDGIDINMGCPDKSIEKQGCGSAMIKTPAKAQAIIRAAKEGAVRDDGTRLPISVKTRIGYNKNELETWLPALLEAGPAVITLHARTRKEMSKVPARWEHVKRAVEIRDEFFSNKNNNQKLSNRSGNSIDAVSEDGVYNTDIEKTLILGNGDVLSIQDGYEKCKATGADGAMIGRAIFGNPWLFKNLNGNDFNDTNTGAHKDGAPGPAYEPTLHEKLKVMVEHTREFEKRLGDIKNFAIMKKHYKAYVNGFDGAKELRMELMEKGGNSDQVSGVVDNFLKGV